jgi:hypothetical protein
MRKKNKWIDLIECLKEFFTERAINGHLLDTATIIAFGTKARKVMKTFLKISILLILRIFQLWKA